MKTQGEIESAISGGMSRFEQEYMGRGPKDVRAHLIDDLVVVRLKGVLTAAEQHLVKTLPTDKGRDLLKQVRSHLIETARPTMEAMVEGITGVKVLSLHHDISTALVRKSSFSPWPSRPYSAKPKKDKACESVNSSNRRHILPIFLNLPYYSLLLPSHSPTVCKLCAWRVSPA
jgi:uncharacterized protein YbcI